MHARNRLARGAPRARGAPFAYALTLTERPWHHLCEAVCMLKFHHVLVAVDFGESSREALNVAIDISKQYDSALTLMHTWEIPVYAYGAMEFNAIDMLSPLQDLAQTQLDRLLAEVRAARPKAKGVLSLGVAWSEILAAIERLQPDLVVMGTHGRQGVRHLIVGSVAEKIVRVSPVSVLTVRANARAPKGKE